MILTSDNWVRWTEILLDEGLLEAAVAVADRAGTDGTDVVAAYAQMCLGRPEAALARLVAHPAEPDPVVATLGAIVRAAARGALGDAEARAWVTVAAASASGRGGHPAVVRLIGAMSEYLGDRVAADWAWEAALADRTGPDRALVDRVIAGRVADRDRDSEADVRRALGAAVRPLAERRTEDWPDATPTMAGLDRAFALLRRWGDVTGVVLLARMAATTLPPHPTTARIRREHRRAPGSTRAERAVLRGLRGFGPPEAPPPPVTAPEECVCRELGGLRGPRAWTYVRSHLVSAPATGATVAGLGDDVTVRRCPVTGVPWLTGRLGYAGSWLALAGTPPPAERTGMYL